MLLNLPFRYWGYISLVVGIYSFGWFCSYNYYKVKQDKIELAVLRNDIARKDKIVAVNNKSLTNMNKNSLELKQKIEGLNYTTNQQYRNNENAKNAINYYNTITYGFLCSVQATSNSNCQLSDNAVIASGAIANNRTVPAYEYGRWALGLKNHADKCVIKYNTLLKIYNEQKELINSGV